MKNKPIIYFVIVIVALVVVYLAFFNSKKAVVPIVTVTSFETCAQASYPVLESKPRQCKTPDGRTYAEEIPEKIVYNNATAEQINTGNFTPGAVTGKEFTISGSAVGTWYFEASFPVKVLDKNGNVLFSGPAQAQGDWMTTKLVPYKITIKVPTSYIGPATLILSKDNPSGLPEKDASISLPFTIEY